MDWVLNLISEPDRKAKATAFQEKQCVKFESVLKRHPSQTKFIFAQTRETHIRTQLEQFQQDHLEQYANGTLTDEQIAHIENLMNQLAESLALQSNFDDAESICFDAAKRAEYQVYNDALKKLNQNRCACPETKRIASPTNARGVEVQNKQLLEEFWDDEKGKVIQFWRCLVCNSLSAKTQ